MDFKVIETNYHGVLLTEVCVHDTWNLYKPTNDTTQLLCKIFGSSFNKFSYKLDS